MVNIKCVISTVCCITAELRHIMCTNVSSLEHCTHYILLILFSSCLHSIEAEATVLRRCLLLHLFFVLHVAPFITAGPRLSVNGDYNVETKREDPSAASPSPAHLGAAPPVCVWSRAVRTLLQINTRIYKEECLCSEPGWFVRRGATSTSSRPGTTTGGGRRTSESESES